MITREWLFALVRDIILTILEKASVGFRYELKKFIFDLEERARKTDNPYDDFLVELIKSLLFKDEK